VLVGVDDVEAGIGEEAADRGDQPRPVRAGQQQARCRVLRDPCIMPLRSRKIRFKEIAGSSGSRLNS
jgi:hypothetical protein